MRRERVPIVFDECQEGARNVGDGNEGIADLPWTLECDDLLTVFIQFDLLYCAFGFPSVLYCDQ